MRKYTNPKTNCTTYEIMAGEYVSTRDRQAVLSTLLGSCVAVCLSDRLNCVYGINHFMLPGTQKTGSIPDDPRFGSCATDLLIADMLKKGADLRFMEAKVFGAGRVVDQPTFKIAEKNAEFILEYLDLLNIPIVASDLGKDYGRKVMFLCHSGEVLIKRIDELKFVSAEMKVQRRLNCTVKCGRQTV